MALIDQITLSKMANTKVLSIKSESFKTKSNVDFPTNLNKNITLKTYKEIISYAFMEVKNVLGMFEEYQNNDG